MDYLEAERFDPPDGYEDPFWMLVDDGPKSVRHIVAPAEALTLCSVMAGPRGDIYRDSAGMFGAQCSRCKSMWRQYLREKHR